MLVDDSLQGVCIGGLDEFGASSLPQALLDAADDDKGSDAHDDEQDQQQDQLLVVFQEAFKLGWAMGNFRERNRGVGGLFGHEIFGSESRIKAAAPTKSMRKSIFGEEFRQIGGFGSI